MISKPWAILQGLLRHYHGEDMSVFVKFLPEEEQEAFLKASIGSPSKKHELFPHLESKISRIHYSWLTEKFQSFSGEEIYHYYLSVLSKKQAEGVSRLVGVPQREVSCSSLGKKFLLHKLGKELLDDKEELPFHFLPESPCNVLLDQSKRGLVNLINFLGIRSLAEKLLDLNCEKLMKAVGEVLSSKKKDYLSLCLEEGLASPFYFLQLEEWDGDKRKMEMLLHQEGLKRLAQTLSGEHLGLLWHLCHKLDNGRGSALMDDFSGERKAEETNVLVSQLSNLLSFLGKGTT